MARYSATWETVTCGAVADASPQTIANYPGSIRGAAALEFKVNEVYIGGEDTASTPTSMVLSRVTTLSVGAQSVGNLVLLDALATAPGTLPTFGNTNGTSYPTRSAASYLLGLSLNTYGGISRWQARYGEEITFYGNTQPLGECLLSSRVGTGKTSGHILLEVV